MLDVNMVSSLKLSLMTNFGMHSRFSPDGLGGLRGRHGGPFNALTEYVL